MSENSLTLVRSLKDVQTEETTGGLREIRETREKLGQFTLRDMSEAIYGKEFTDLTVGSEGDTKMADINVEFRGDAEGNLVTRVPLGHQLTHEQSSKAGQLLEERHRSLDNDETRAARVKEHDRQLREEANDSATGLSAEEMATLKKLLGKLKD